MPPITGGRLLLIPEVVVVQDSIASYYSEGKVRRTHSQQISISHLLWIWWESQRLLDLQQHGPAVWGLCWPVLKVMHSAVDFAFLFDHSSGHSNSQLDGSNQHRMNRLFGGRTLHQCKIQSLSMKRGTSEPFLEYRNLETRSNLHAMNSWILVRFGRRQS